MFSRTALVAARPLATRFALQRTAARAGGVMLQPQLQQARSYLTVERQSRQQLLERLENLEAEVLSANWADYLVTCHNVPFWECEKQVLDALAVNYAEDPELGPKWKLLNESFDVLFKCEDVRDHLNELMEVSSRAGGVMGTGYAATEPCSNVEEHAEHCRLAYEALLAEHPAFISKIESTVGHGLALLRQKSKFRFHTMHRYAF